MLKVQSLRQELKAAGLFERCEGRTWAKLFFMLSIVAGLLVAHTLLPLWASVLLVPVTGWFCAVAGMMGHEGSHRCVSDTTWRNQLLFHIAFPLLGGVSGLYWHNKHDVKHHTHPNVIDADDDVQMWPVASSTLDHRNSSPARQWFQENLQGFFFWPLTLMTIWAMRLEGIQFLWNQLRSKKQNRAAWWADVCCLVLHVLGWVVLPLYFFGPWALALYVGVWMVAGIVLAMIFITAHFGRPLVTENNDIWLRQFESTRNLKMPRWLSFFYIGLDYQIEHHLFPRIPHQRLPEAAVITKRWAEQHGIVYQEMSYWKALHLVTRHMAICWSLPPDEIGLES